MKDLIPTLLLTLVATYCVARWTVLWRTGRRDGVSRGDTLYAAICFAVGVVVFGIVGMFGLCTSREMLPLVACALQLPGLLLTAAVASIGAPPQSRRTLGNTWLVIVAGGAFAVGSCFAVLVKVADVPANWPHALVSRADLVWLEHDHGPLPRSWQRFVVEERLLLGVSLLALLCLIATFQAPTTRPVNGPAP